MSLHTAHCLLLIAHMLASLRLCSYVIFVHPCGVAWAMLNAPTPWILERLRLWQVTCMLFFATYQ